MTLDQQRAAYAWRCASQPRSFDGYKELTKGAAALVMGSGLMAALAYWQSRKSQNREPAQALVADLLAWLAQRKMLPSAGFEGAMQHMTQQASAHHMALTDEALALLRWLKQFADSVSSETTR